MKTLSLLLAALLLLASSPCLAGAAGKMVILHSESLNYTMKVLERRFKSKHKDIRLKRVAAPTEKLAGLAASPKTAGDVVISDDYTMIDRLIPQQADYTILFARNQMALCFMGQSKFASQVNATNWTDILQKEDVRWSYPDPSLDPCGARTLIVLQLAEKVLELPGFSDAMIKRAAPENIKPKALELVTLMDSGVIDYSFQYLSTAVVRDLGYVVLDDQINLGDYHLDKEYSQASASFTGLGGPTSFSGKSMTYGTTILANAPNPEGAETFLGFLLDQEGGLKIFEERGQAAFFPARTIDETMKSQMPPSLQKLIEINF